MKKYIKILGLACMAGALAFMTSCKKNETSTSIRVGIPAFEVETDGERAYIDINSGDLFWQDGDAIMVFNVNSTDPQQSAMAYYTAVAGSEGQTYTTFETNQPSMGPMQDRGYFVYYPAYRRNATQYSDPVMGDIKDGNRITFTVEPQQKFTKNGNSSTLDPDAFVMAWNGENIGNFMMEHAFASMRLSLYGNDKIVDHINVIDPDVDAATGEPVALCGKVSINIAALTQEGLANIKSLMKDYRNGDDAAGAEAIRTLVYDYGYLPEEKLDNKITVDCSDYFVQLRPDAGSEFVYVSVRPGAFKNGVIFEIYYTDGTYQTVTEFNHNDNQNSSYARPFLSIPGGMKKYDINVYGYPYQTY